ncbi:hypothetical protein [Yoonia sp. BS5-3]|uniref:DUF4274 domain-containing protein n=1 Tax=Yoonia phaeophyticola TaxID=3137369 RepID=A0ABZ2V703_9RHOB
MPCYGQIKLPMNQATSPHRAPTKAETALQRVLKSAPQELWLDTIRRCKGPQHDGLISWMINQPQCDFAVAVHAFYRSDPGHYLDLPRPLPTAPEPSDIFAQLLINWDAGYYRDHQLAVDKRDIDPRQLVRINQKIAARPPGSLPFSVPKRFLDPVGGAARLLPPSLSPDNARHLWPIYAQLGLQVPPSAPGIRRTLAALSARLTPAKRPEQGL